MLFKNNHTSKLNLNKKASNIGSISSLNLQDLQIVPLEDRLELALCNCCECCNCANAQADRIRDKNL